MKVHPRNEGTDSVDLAMLIGMPLVILVLTGVIWYLAVMTLEAMAATGAA